MPPATGGLGCAVQMELPAPTGCPRRGSIKDARAAISVFECRPVGEAHKRQGPPCSCDDMPKGPRKLPSTVDDDDVSCTATRYCPSIRVGCLNRTSETVASPSATGFRRGSHRNSNGFVGFACTQLQEAVVILGGPSRTHNGANFDHFSQSVSTPLRIQFSIRGLFCSNVTPQT